MRSIINNIENKYNELFSGKPLIVRSPGRVNLIGEHTDYNEGFVLPAAIDKAIIMAITSREDDQCRIYAADLDDHFECKVSSFERSDKGWPNYVMGVVDQILKRGLKINGFDCVFGGNIPLGAGLSSSAALEGSVSFALNQLYNLGLSKTDLVNIGQKTEHEFVGVKCGIMDQFINIYAEQKTVLKLDCRSYDYEYFPFGLENIKIVLCDTQTRRELATSEYNIRRQQCESGVDILRRHNQDIQSLRDVSLDFLETYKAELDEIVYRRCEYVIKENERVLAGCQDLKRGDIASFGKKMFASHFGLRDDYEVSSPELDVLVDIAAEVPGVLGARMMGAGFGGCTINLIEEEYLNDFTVLIRDMYKEKVSKDLKYYVCSIEAGTSEVVAKLVEV